MDRSEFRPDEYERRLHLLHRLLAEAPFDALLILDEANYRYITGHYTEAWKIPLIRRACWVSRDRPPVLIVSPGEAADAHACSPWSDVREYSGPEWGVLRVAGDLVFEYDTSFVRAITEVAREFGLAGAQSIGIALHGWTHVNVPLGVIDDVRQALEATWVDATPLLWEARLIKSAPELEYARAAVLALDQAFAATLPVIEAGMSEAHIARLVRANIMLAGGDHEAFTFVAADINQPRSVGAAPGEEKVREGSVMYIDAGADVHGYRSDYNRVAVIGEPTAEQERAYDLVVRAYKAGFRAIRPGVAAGEVARAMLEILADDGGHVAPLGAVGHGIGVELPEPPYLHPDAKLELAEGMVMTIEPNVFVPNVGRMIVEDVVVVTAHGAQHLSGAPTRDELIRVG